MIVCDVCPRACHLDEGKTGFCGVRGNREGVNIDVLYRRLYDVNGPYNGGIVAFLPGCNMKCWYCGLPFLWKITPDRYQEITENELVNKAISSKSPGICLFGGEPAIHHEYVLETARLCRENGVQTLLLTNGFISPWLARLYATAIDFPIVGIKGSGSTRLYADMNANPTICLQTAKILWKKNERTGITDLIGPDLKYTEQDDREFAAWICRNISADVNVRIEILGEQSSSTDLTLPFSPIGGLFEATRRVLEILRRFKDAGLRNVEPPLYMDCLRSFRKTRPGLTPTLRTDHLEGDGR